MEVSESTRNFIAGLKLRIKAGNCDKAHAVNLLVFYVERNGKHKGAELIDWAKKELES